VNTSHHKQSRYIYVLGKNFAREDVDAQNQTTKTYFVTDIEGNIVQATDEKGNSKWKRDFLPFGMSTSEEGNVDEEAGFTGKDYDADVEMTYFNARWYDPELGRFVEEDPMTDDPNLTERSQILHHDYNKSGLFNPLDFYLDFVIEFLDHLHDLLVFLAVLLKVTPVLFDMNIELLLHFIDFKF
jgi:RHS repeat-associated protein